jgi:[acyl-carrier-protein] S-malonyltransferase
MKAGLFPGQGVRAVDVYEALMREGEHADLASEILGYDLRRKVAPYASRKSSVMPTWLAQPAIFTGGVMAHEAAIELGHSFDCYLGHSVGEFTSLVAAGAISFKDGVKVLDVRGRTMHRAAQVRSGGMVALLSLTDDDVASIAEMSGASVANDNAPGQVVLAGDESSIGLASQMACDRGGRAVLLDVTGAFHTEAMKAVRLPLQDVLFSVAIRSWARPVLSNVTARPYRSPGEVRKLLVEQVTSRVRFRDALEFLMKRGVMEFEDLGPGRVVGGLAQRTKRSLMEAAHV